MVSRILPFLVLSILLARQNLVAGSAEDFPPISENTRISLITISPGTELWARWGHSAIRVFDPATGLDWVYNYGTFDFNAPGFYIKFLRGNLNYSLSVYDFKYMVLAYRETNQSIFEQVLNLSYKEKKQVYEFINTNALPENRYYLYEFFFDNCSSRIRDVFKDILQDKLIFHDDFVINRESYRQLVNDYLDKAPWEKFGINLIFGMQTDSLASPVNYMFLPVEMKNAFADSEKIEEDKKNPFVKESRFLFKEIPLDEHVTWFTPVKVFWLLFFVYLLVTGIEIKYNSYLKIPDFILFLGLGLAGLCFAFLWFGTNHIETMNNINMYWAFPVHAVASFYIFRDPPRKWLSYYFLFWSIFLTLMITGWKFIPQHFHWAVLPIMLTAILRSVIIYFHFKPKK